MPISDRYHFEVLAHFVLETVIDQKLSPVQLPVTSEPISFGLGLYVPFSAISPYLVTSAIETPIFDAALLVPIVPISFSTMSLGGPSMILPPASAKLAGFQTDTIPAVTYDNFRRMYHDLYMRYREVLETRDVILGMIAISAPAGVAQRDSPITRNVLWRLCSRLLLWCS